MKRARQFAKGKPKQKKKGTASTSTSKTSNPPLETSLPLPGEDDFASETLTTTPTFPRTTTPTFPTQPLQPGNTFRAQKEAHTSVDGDSCHEFSFTNNVKVEDQNEGNQEGNQVDSASYVESNFPDGREHMERPGGVMEDSLDYFGKYVSSILRLIPVPESCVLQKKFIDEAISARLAYERVCPSSPPPQKRIPIPEFIDTTNRPQPHSELNMEDPLAQLKPSKAAQRKKKKTGNKSSSENQPASPLRIKEELIDDPDPMTDIGLGRTESMVTSDEQGFSHIDIEDGPGLSALKQEIESDFGILFCDPPFNQEKPVESIASERLEVPPDNLSSSTQAKPLFNCSLCSKSCPTSQDLKNHYSYKHPGLNPYLKNKPSSGTPSSSKRPCIEDNSSTIMTVPLFSPLASSSQYMSAVYDPPPSSSASSSSTTPNNHPNLLESQKHSAYSLQR